VLCHSSLACQQAAEIAPGAGQPHAACGRQRVRTRTCQPSVDYIPEWTRCRRGSGCSQRRRGFRACGRRHLGARCGNFRRSRCRGLSLRDRRFVGVVSSDRCRPGRHGGLGPMCVRRGGDATHTPPAPPDGRPDRPGAGSAARTRPLLISVGSTVYPVFLLPVSYGAGKLFRVPGKDRMKERPLD